MIPLIDTAPAWAAGADWVWAVTTCIAAPARPPQPWPQQLLRWWTRPMQTPTSDTRRDKK